MKTGKIYKIISLDGIECYVGSTFGTIRDRWYKHKGHYNLWKKNKKSYVSSFQLFEQYGLDRCKILLIKEYGVEDRAHLDVYETLWIKKLKAINKTEPCGRLLGKRKQCMYSKQYQTKYAETLKVKRDKYRSDNCELLKERKRAYYQENRDILLQKISALQRQNSIEAVQTSRP